MKKIMEVEYVTHCIGVDDVFLVGVIEEPVRLGMEIVVKHNDGEWYGGEVLMIVKSCKLISEAKPGEKVELKVSNILGKVKDGSIVYLYCDKIVEDPDILEQLEKEGVDESDIQGALDSEKVNASTIIDDPKEVNKLLNKALKLCDQLSRIPVIGNVFVDIPLVCFLISDYVKGEYREVPLASIITLTAAILYFVNPVDLIPDIVPGVGKLDDAAVISYALMAVHGDLEAYAVWRSTQ